MTSDPSRLVDEASGFPWHGGGDIQDNHGGISRPNPRQISIVSENGGYGLATTGPARIEREAIHVP